MATIKFKFSRWQKPAEGDKPGKDRVYLNLPRGEDVNEQGEKRSIFVKSDSGGVMIESFGITSTEPYLSGAAKAVEKLMGDEPRTYENLVRLVGAGVYVEVD